MLIGELASRSQMSKDTIRFYEKCGLLVGAQKRENNYKDYSPEAVERLSLIQSLKLLGFTLHEIKDFVILWGKHASCENLIEGIRDKLELVDRQITQLKKTKKQLIQLTKRCKGKDCGFVKRVPSCLCSSKGCC
ncbi:MAG: MerR family transcriptional regulator [Patescibacteria group bacterium]